MWRAILKLLQRRLYTFLATPSGCTICLLCVFATLNTALLVFGTTGGLLARLTRAPTDGHDLCEGNPCCGSEAAADNIAGRPFAGRLCFPAIDVVYTWVNGSDPVWLESMLRYKREHREEEEAAAEAAIAAVNATSPGLAARLRNKTVTASARSAAAATAGGSGSSGGRDGAPGTASPGGNIPVGISADGMEWGAGDGWSGDRGEPAPAEEEEDHLEAATSSNRYRDNEELRFSLRSLEAHAPWVRRVYLVTDNQIPAWVDLENDRLRIVTHGDIFPNASHLPTFSSPAIEAHLHRIPGLSRHFLYFNDDVFLGADVWPDDFMSPSGSQNVFLSWDVPRCASSCPTSWLADGYCDQACNNADCHFDRGDCVNVTSGEGPDVTASAFADWQARTDASSGGEPHLPGYCSEGCPSAWIGDKVCDLRCNVRACGFDGTDCGTRDILADLPGYQLSAEGGAQQRMTLSVPWDAPAVYFNLSALVGGATLSEAEHSNEDAALAAVYQQSTGLLVLVLQPASNWNGHGHEAVPGEPLTEVRLAAGGRSVRFNLTRDAPLHEGGAPDAVPDTDPRSANSESAGVGADDPASGDAFLRRASELVRRLHARGDGSSSGAQGSLPGQTLEEVADLIAAAEAEGSSGDMEELLEALMGEQGEEVEEEEVAGPPGDGAGDQEPEGEGDEAEAKEIEEAKVTGEEEEEEEEASPAFSPHQRSEVDHALQEAVNASARAEAERVAAAMARVKSRAPSLPRAGEGGAGTRRLLSTPHEPSLPPSSRLGGSRAPVRLVWGGLAVDEQARGLVLPASRAHSDTGRASWLSWLRHRLALPSLRGAARGTLSPAAGLMRDAATPGTPSPAVVEEEAEEALLARIADAKAKQLELWDAVRRRRRAAEAFKAPSAQARRSALVEAARRLVQRPAGQGSNVAQLPRTWPALAPGDARGWSRAPASVDAAPTAATLLARLARWVTGSMPLAAAPPPRPLLPAAPRTGEEPAPGAHTTARRLLGQDTYGSSLRYVDNLLHERFGIKARKVPAHMPHMVDATVVRSMQEALQPHVDATSAARFRSPRDLQFAFTYFYWLMETADVAQPDLREVWERDLDTDGDGVLDQNEIRTLCAMAHGDTLTYDSYAELMECLAAPEEERRMERTVSGEEVEVVRRVNPQVTYERFLACPKAVDGVLAHARTPKRYQVVDLSEVAFEMVGDEGNKTLRQLDSIRARRSKFICVNDDMRHPTRELQDALLLFYLSFFPNSSSFELAPTLRNTYLRVPELRAFIRRQWILRATLFALLVFLAAQLAYGKFVEWRSKRRRPGSPRAHAEAEPFAARLRQRVHAADASVQ